MFNIAGLILYLVASVMLGVGAIYFISKLLKINCDLNDAVIIGFFGIIIGMIANAVGVLIPGRWNNFIFSGMLSVLGMFFLLNRLSSTQKKYFRKLVVILSTLAICICFVVLIIKAYHLK